MNDSLEAIGGLRDQILANAQLLFLKTYKDHMDMPGPDIKPFDIALLQSDNGFIAKLYQIPKLDYGGRVNWVAESCISASEAEALAALLAVLSKKLFEKKQDLFHPVDNADVVVTVEGRLNGKFL